MCAGQEKHPAAVFQEGWQIRIKFPMKGALVEMALLQCSTEDSLAGRKLKMGAIYLIVKIM